MKLSFKRRLPGWYPKWPGPESILSSDFLNWSEFYPFSLGVNIPSANIKETPAAYELDLAAPGLSRKDFHLEVSNHTLSISAEKEEEKKSENGYTRREFSYNSFGRTFTLPENTNADRIDAKYEAGVLKVIIPKLKETPVEKAKKITVG